jgi:hypothetical protein
MPSEPKVWRPSGLTEYDPITAPLLDPLGGAAVGGAEVVADVGTQWVKARSAASDRAGQPRRSWSRVVLHVSLRRDGKEVASAVLPIGELEVD